jgi:outer membrane lipase/esterase
MQTKYRPIRSLLAAALALAAAPALAQDGTFSQTVFFGDSLTDAGFFTPLLVQQNPQAAVLGRFTTNPGLVWSEYLADIYGTDASMAWTATGATPTPGDGTNYAVGGARVGQDSVGALGYTPSLATQANAYLSATGGRADANALYTVWGGANDLFAVAQGAPAEATIGSAVTAQIGIVGALQNAGARYVLVPTIPDIGLAPDFSGNPLTSGQGTALANAYNGALFGGLAQAGLSVIPVDTFHFLQEVVANPAEYGFGNVTDRACLPPGSSSLTCNPATYASPDAPNSYLFADGVHPATRAHELVADLAVSMIEGPRQVAILPHVAATVGRARADMVSGQAALVRGEDDGTRWWVDGRYDYQRYGQDRSADLYDGGGGGLTVGVDWTRGGLVYGAFGGFSHQVMDWGLRRGDFRQDDTTLGGYLGWSSDHAWVNGQLSYSQLGYDLKRKVRLGPATREYASDVDGDNLTAAISGGWSFGEDAFRHGPVASIVAQRIDIDGFAEDRPGESTSLAFAEQNYDSLIASAGWQMSYAIKEHFVPYLRVTWDRELEDMPAQASAQAQSIPGSLPYVVPGVEFDDSYGTLTYGTRAQLWGMELLSGSSITLGRADGLDSSLWMTLRGEF